MADREGDLRALMDAAARRAHAANGLVRAQHNRKTVSGDKPWSRAEKTDPLGEVEFTLPDAPGRAARRVRQTLYRDAVTLPAHRKEAPKVTVTAILAREEQPSAGEKPIEWRLLTNRTAETLEAVMELIDGYRRRWLVEIDQPYHLH